LAACQGEKMTTNDTVYAELCGAKGDPTGLQKFYQIYYTEPLPGQWKGPYRDATDAENAAEDEAKAKGVTLIWRS
jgi:hypothetical protein